MYAIKEHSRSIRGVKIPTFSRVIEGANLLYVEAGTNGFRGGDTGAGSRAYIRIEDLGGTDIVVRPVEPYMDGVEIFLGGDSELNAMITGLEFILKVLKEEAMEVND